MKKQLFLAALGAACILVSCSKKDEINAPSIVGKWRFEKQINILTLNGGQPDTIITPASAEVCNQDDYQVYLANGTTYKDRGAVLCPDDSSYTSSPQDTAQYAVSADQKQLYITAANYKDTFSIKALTNTSLILYERGEGRLYFDTVNSAYTSERYFKRLP